MYPVDFVTSDESAPQLSEEEMHESDLNAAAPTNFRDPQQKGFSNQHNTGVNGLVKEVQTKTINSDSEPLVFFLDPFRAFVMRFNYTEVGDVKSYAAALTEELKEVQLTFSYR